MKAILAALLVSCTVSLAANGAVAQITKTSTKEFDIPKEIKAFYSSLLDGNAEVKHQFEAATQASREDNGGTFHVFEPQVIDWFPSEDHWNVSKGFDCDDHYLVIQPIGLGRGRAETHDNAIVSEFEVIEAGKTKYDESDEAAGRDPTLISNTITIKFLGFRSFTLTPLKSDGSAEQSATHD